MLVAESKAQTTLLYYWSFDTLSAPLTGPAAGDFMVHLPINSDSTTMNAPGTINWEPQPGAPAGTASTLWIDNVTADGCTINAQGSAIANEAKSIGLRPRNPSLYAELIFNIPTTGYKGITFTFATESSGSGIGTQAFDYSVDGGSTFSTTGIAVTSNPSAETGLAYEDSVTANWGLVTVDLTAATAVNNSSNLILRLIYKGPKATTGASGNDRLDNITVWGTALTTGVSNPSAADAGYSLYPNPTSDVVYLSAPTTSSKYITIYNAQGQPVYTSTVSGQQSSLSIASLTSGIYYVNINDNGTNYSIKFAKN